MNLRKIIAVTLFIVVGLTGSISAQVYPNNGLITVESAYSGPNGVQQTVDQLVTNLEAKGLTVMAVVDHGANAASVDLELPPTQLIIFGNPNLGTQLMNNSQSVAIDLPQKYLVWSESTGRTFVSYNGVPYLAQRHGLTGPEEVLQTVTGALANFAKSITQPSTGPSVSPTAVPPTAVPPTAVPSTAVPTPTDPPPVVLPTTGTDLNNNLLPFWVALALLAIGLGALLVGMVKNRTIRLWSLVGLLALTGFASSLLIQQGAKAQQNSGLVALDSPYSVEETVTRLQSEITERGLNIMRVIDHAANAAKVDRELRPTQVILFGNPKVGTPLMQSNRTIGIDLPQKMLVWEDDAGAVHIAYNDPDYLRLRHNILGRDEVLARVTGALSAIADAAVSTSSAEPTGVPEVEPTDAPVEEPTDASTAEPTAVPVPEPTVAPVVEPTGAPEEEPTAAPVEEPTAVLANTPTPVADTSFPGNFAEILTEHNRVRTQAGRPAFTWNNDLQLAADNWARTMAANGALQHDPNLFAVPGQFGSENISWQQATLSQMGVVNDPTFGWASTLEREAYAASGGCPNVVDAAGRVCGHYKTIIEADFSQIGCGLTPSGEFNYWVCRYK